ncbi:MAG: radical SAM protein [Dehalococcoidales bacterium]|jgi:radical SAM superfamily enzyme YgiQ (UPF0313 family)
MPFIRPQIIRPPSESKSYFLPLTGGCSNNTCTFCSYYGSKLQVRELEDIKKEIDAVALYAERGIFIPGMPDIVYAISQNWDGKSLFLQDGDALVYPLPGLKAALEYINQKLPFVERIATYATAQDILRISPGELQELNKLKLGILYMGLESGDDDVLRRIAKGVDSKQMITAAQKAKKANILTSITVILGLGGIWGSEKHALETSKVLSDMDPDYVGALTLTMVPGKPLHEEWQQGNFPLISPFQSLKELLTIIENANFTNCFFSSMHASNYFAIRGKLPGDKERMLGELKSVINKGDPYSLRPEFLRGL